MDLDSVRREFPALDVYGWFQNGGVSITPRVVHSTLQKRLHELFMRGPMHIVYPDEEYPRREASRKQLAQFFDVEPTQLAIVRGVSEAFQAVLLGIDWQAGDQIVISDDEEAALLLPVLHLARQYGVEVVRLPARGNADQQVAELRRHLQSGRVKLLAISHVTTDIGFRFAVARLCDLARSHDVISFVDLAHSCGLFPLRLNDLKCDFAGLLSYKWMYGPYAVGSLYVRDGSLDKLAVPFIGGRSEKSLDFESLSYELGETAQRFEYGPWCWPLVHAWAAAADFLAGVGLESIWRRTRLLTDRLRQQLAELPQVKFFTPEAEEDSASLLSIQVGDWRGDDLAHHLRQNYNLIVKALPHTRQGLRISLPFFLLEAEIDQLAKAIAAA